MTINLLTGLPKDTESTIVAQHVLRLNRFDIIKIDILYELHADAAVILAQHCNMQKYNHHFLTDLCNLAAKHNCMNVLRICVSRVLEAKYGTPWDLTASYAARYNNLACLLYCCEHGSDLSYDVAKNAASFGHLLCLQYAQRNGCDCGSWATAYTAAGGYMDCLRYVHQNGYPWHASTIKIAQRYISLGGLQQRYLDCVQYARDNGCPE